ncbi:AI-2E family transporter [Blastococcus mobilis]|uniref:Predicted PurR-regulated permease PerM n=1 Tax=Blastococcus mobilis TaxID=1938746 RepID=A0A238ZWC1_9ACTN|nr:AI-2E family transporter [Blastococcus mobilis]SNR87717.1 Predicted PurR-regulated permease PerM [Blastococcus mobilis]
MTTPARDRRPYPRWLEFGAGVAVRFLVILIAVGAVVWMALQVTLVVTAAVLGFAVVSMLWPMVRWLRNLRVPPVLAAIVCVLLLLGAFAVLCYFVVSQIVANIPALVDAGASLVDSFTTWAADLPLTDDSPLAREALAQLEATVGAVLSGLGSGLFAGLGALGDFATVLGVAIFFAIFALTGGDKLWRQFCGLLPEDTRKPATDSFRAVMTTTGGWFYASTLTGLIDGVLIGAGLLVLGVPLAVPIAALTFVLGYIPLVGATLAGVAAVGVAFVAGGWGTAIWALVIVLAVQQLEGNVLSPLLMSRAVDFPPLVTLLLTTTAGLAFGIAGLFLAVPVVGAIVAAATTYHRSRGTRSSPSAAPPPPPGSTAAPATES